MPPLIKGYLRVGGVIGDGAVIDYDFITVDVNIIVETENVTSKYLNHYTRDSDKAAAEGHAQNTAQSGATTKRDAAA